MIRLNIIFTLLEDINETNLTQFSLLAPGLREYQLGNVTHCIFCSLFQRKFILLAIIIATLIIQSTENSCVKSAGYHGVYLVLEFIGIGIWVKRKMFT